MWKKNGKKGKGECLPKEEKKGVERQKSPM